MTRSLLVFIVLHCSLTPAYTQQKPMVVQEQGSFAIGGSVVKSPEGNTLHGDHAYVFYQKPVKPRKYPLVFIHGVFQFSKTWETTPDGREGFQNIFLRRDFSTYNMNLPRRGNAGRATVNGTITATPDEQFWFNRFRVGVWPNFNKGVQFKQDSATLNQYFRQVTPNTAPFDFDVTTKAITELCDQLKGAIVVCHSMGGLNTWLAVPRTNNIKGVVAWEPGGFLSFPDDEPKPQTNFPVEAGLEYIMVKPDVFEKFTKMPIVIIYGDYIPDAPTGHAEVDEWGLRLKLARLWATAVNKRGGDVTVIHLPELGFKGNTHFPFSDLNNIEMADLMSKWLKEKKLD